MTRRRHPRREIEELIDELAEKDPAIRSRIAAALERRELQRNEDTAGGDQWADYSALADDTDWEKLYEEDA